MTPRRVNDLKFFTALAILFATGVAFGSVALPASALIKHPIERSTAR